MLRRRRTLLGVTLRLRGGGADEEGLSAYELMRLARIRENNAALAALDIVPLAGKADARMAAAQRKWHSVAEASVQPSRSSTRLAELPRPNYVEEPDVARREQGSSSATSVPKPPGRPPRGADGVSCTWARRFFRTVATIDSFTLPRSSGESASESKRAVTRCARLSGVCSIL